MTLGRMLLAMLCVLAGLTTTSASAATYLHDGAYTGSLSPVGSTFSTTTLSGNVVMTSATGNITCSAAALSATVTANASGTVAATIPSGGMSFSGCTGAGSAGLVSRCDTASSTSLTTTGTSSTTGTVTFVGWQLACKTSAGLVLCTWGSGLGFTTTMSAPTLSANSLQASGVTVGAVGGGLNCFGTATVAFTLTNLRSNAAGSPIVVLNNQP